MGYWVYMLRCADDTLYTGSTTDPKKRLAVHQSGKGAKYTRSRLPVRLIYQEETADKSAALKELAARYGIGPDEIAAFGDGENDLGMVGYAGHGYIMANARPGVKQRAANIAPSNAEDGLAQVVEGWLANGEIPERNEETGCTGGRNDDQSR